MEQDLRTYRFSLIRELIFIVFFRKYLVISVFLVFLALNSLLALLLPPSYRSSGKFVIYIPQQLDPLRQETFYDYQGRAERLLQDQKELIFSQRVLNRVIERLEPNLPEPKRMKMISQLSEKIEVTPPRGATFKESNTFFVTFSDANPERAKHVAQLLCDAYLEAFSELGRESSSFSLSFYRDQAKRLYEELLQKEKELREYEVANADVLLGILNMLTTQGGPNMEVGPNSLLTQFRARYYELQEKLAGIQVGVAALEKELNKGSPPAIPGELQVVGHAITAFKSKVAQLEIQLNELRAQFTDRFPAVQSTQRELQMNMESLRKELERTILAQKVTAQSLAAQIAELDRVISELQENVKNIAAARSGYEHLKQQYEMAKQAYQKARDQMHQAELALALDQSKQTLTFVEPPALPEKPYKPNRLLLVALGFVGGIIMALAVSVTVDYFDHSIRRPEDIVQNVGIPVFASIPRVQ